MGFQFIHGYKYEINGNVNNVLNLKQEKKLIAPYDAYPDLDWTLESQFNGVKRFLIN